MIDTIFWSEYLSTVALTATIHIEVIKSKIIPDTTLHNTLSSHDAAEVNNALSKQHFFQLLLTLALLKSLSLMDITATVALA